MNMGKALYRKYRSKSLSEVVGQEHITNALQKALDSGNISHAYLFTGPKGVGKTSVARILAHEINKLPYKDDETVHLDIIEIDAASNRRIDEVRDLKDKVHIAPTSAKYKVYIVDEVHMLTKEAFNALLKTLEEPPAHVVFILATTEAHKLPETIISRTQRYTFRPVARKAVVDHLQSIAKAENISVSKDALELIARHGEGSFRDSISLLDQMRHSSGEINKTDVEDALGIAPEELIFNTLDSLKSSDKTKLVVALNELVDQGVDIVRFAHQLSAALRSNLISDKNGPAEKDLLLLDALARVGTHPRPSVALDIALYRHILEEQPRINQPETSQVLETDQNIESHQDSETDHNNTELEPLAIYTDELEINVMVPPEQSESKADPEWDKVLQALKKRHATLYGVARMGQPQFTENSLTLSFAFAFHMRSIAEEKNRRLLEDLIHEITGKRLAVKAVKAEITRPQPQQIISKPANSEPLESVSNIFGRVEIVES